MKLLKLLQRFFSPNGLLDYKVSQQVGKVYFAVLLGFIPIVVGLVGFIVLEHYSLLEAFYMTIITLATVGFMEVRPLSDIGRVFTALLIIMNTGIFAYAISTITSFVISGDYKKFIRINKMQHKIEQLANHVIICGIGRHGLELVKELSSQREHFVVIEHDHDKVRERLEDSSYIYLHGDATKDEILLQAGIKKAKALLVTVAEESENLYIVLSARELNPSIKIISRCSNERIEKKLFKAGADHVVMPERISGYYMATLISNPQAVEFFNILSNMGSVRVSFDEIPCHLLKKEYLNKSLKELQIRQQTGANVIGLHREDGSYNLNPDGDIIITQSMKLVIIGDEHQIELFKRSMLHS